MTSWADMVDEEEAAASTGEWTVYQPKKKCVDCNKIIKKKYTKCYNCVNKNRSVSNKQKNSKQNINNNGGFRKKWRPKTVRGKLSQGISHCSQQSKEQSPMQSNDIKSSSTKNSVDQTTKKS